MEIEGLMSTFIIVEKTKREKKRRPPCIHYIALVMHRGQLIFDRYYIIKLTNNFSNSISKSHKYQNVCLQLSCMDLDNAPVWIWSKNWYEWIYIVKTLEHDF